MWGGCWCLCALGRTEIVSCEVRAKVENMTDCVQCYGVGRYSVNSGQPLERQIFKKEMGGLDEG